MIHDFRFTEIKVPQLGSVIRYNTRRTEHVSDCGRIRCGFGHFPEDRFGHVYTRAFAACPSKMDNPVWLTEKFVCWISVHVCGKWITVREPHCVWLDNDGMEDWITLRVLEARINHSR